MAQAIDNHLAERHRHTHPEGSVMDNGELRNHMVAYHGWTLDMVFSRGQREGYMRGEHERQHRPGQWDNEPVAPEWIGQ